MNRSRSKPTNGYSKLTAASDASTAIMSPSGTTLMSWCVCYIRPEFPRPVLETLRQPLETGEVVVARANAHVRYPCRFLLIAAANPCRAR